MHFHVAAFAAAAVIRNVGEDFPFNVDKPTRTSWGVIVSVIWRFAQMYIVV